MKIKNVKGRSKNRLVRTLVLDVKFLAVDLSVHEKVEFLFVKYLTYLKYFRANQNNLKYATLYKTKFYFYDLYDFMYIQNVYIENFYLKKFIQQNSVILDIGANVGQFYFFAKHYLNASKIYSVEPAKKSFSALKLNNQAHSFNLAISKTKKVKLFHNGSSLITSKYNYGSKKSEWAEGMKLNTYIQKYILEKNKGFDLIKIDVEGMEGDVVQTSGRSLNFVKYLLIELSINRKSSIKWSRVLNTLEKIRPKLNLIKIGNQFVESGKIDSVDLFFKL